VCAALAGTLEEASRAAGARTHRGGTYLCIEGPQFSTRAESHLYRSFRADLVGMTNMQEVKLAREAGMCYATVAMVTDYDCWREGSEPVSVEEVVARLHENARVAQAIVREAGARLPEARACACARALDNAILTERALIPPETRARLRPLVGRRLD
jgi:5'-methylthioadenosine phosphorylase